MLIVCMPCLPAGAAQAESRREIRAGFFAWDGYHVQDETGLRSGYGFDFLKMTESYCNWHFEFVGYDQTWADMLTLLDRGEIDVLTSAQKTDEWEAKYLYSDDPIGTSSTILSVRREEAQYVVGDPSTYDGMTVGCLHGSSRNDRFAAYAAEKGFTYHPVYFETLDELKKALAARQVDAVLSTNLRTVNGETVLEEFDPVDYYVIVRKSDEALMTSMNKAIRKINLNNPGWRKQLQQKYFSDSSVEEMVFDKDELDYLQALKDAGTVFMVATNPDLAPYSYYDAEGEAQGIAPDLFRELAAQIGLRYEFATFATYQEYNTFVREGHADIDLTCFHDYGLGALHGISITDTFMTTSLAMLSRTDFDGVEKTVGCIRGSNNNTTYTDELFGGKNIITFDTNREGVAALSSGQVDAVYLYAFTAQKAVMDDTRNRLMYTVLPQYEIDLCMGTNDAHDFRLNAILNEGIRALSGTFTRSLIESEVTHIARTKSLVSIVYDYPFYALGALLLMAALILGVIYVLLKRMQAEKLLKKEAETKAARTEFFMLISHELRTPLNAIVSYLRMLREECDLDTKEAEYLGKAQSAANQLTEISDSMLDYANISSGTVELKQGIIKLKDIILQVDQIVSLKAKEKHQRYAFSMSKLSRQYLSGDGLRLALIYQNIMENAVKFTPEGGQIAAELTEQVLDAETVRLLFTCRDTGKGMDGAFVEKINTAFHQSDAAYSRTHGGLGLGLFLTQFFVRLMGGTFQVESQEGHGSTIRISIDMKCPPIDELMQHNIKCQPVRILVCDADAYNVQCAKETLKQIGAKASFLDDPAKVYSRIMGRSGSALAYDVCILNIDQISDVQPILDSLATLEHAPEIFLISEHMEQAAQLQRLHGWKYFISMQESNFELFNALITEFGEFRSDEKQPRKLPDYHGLHAMVVDDNAINADILSKFLRKTGMEVTVYENGKIAVDAFESAAEQTFQLIFMDVQMPVMNGHEATAAIRASHKPQGREIPIIGVSANAFPDDVQQSLDCGMTAHIAKPVDVQRLLEEIQNNVPSVRETTRKGNADCSTV